MCGSHDVVDNRLSARRATLLRQSRCTINFILCDDIVINIDGVIGLTVSVVVVASETEGVGIACVYVSDGRDGPGSGACHGNG